MGRSRKRKTPDRSWIKQILTGVASGVISTLIGEAIKYWLFRK